MILALDVGNTQIYGGLFDKDIMKLSFRRNSKQGSSSDEIGIFLRTVIRENGYDPTIITHITICTVVPDILYSLKGACKKYFNIVPFVLQAGVKTGLRIKYHNPLDVGSDRIANAVAGTHLYNNKNLIIVDLGTATTFCAISKEKDYLGGAIIAGMRLSMEALESKTAKLPSVEIVPVKESLGRSTVESIQSGLYYGHLGSIRELVSKMSKECFPNEEIFVIGTGGFAYLFEKDSIFNVILPDLVLKGTLIALSLNQMHEQKRIDQGN